MTLQTYLAHENEHLAGANFLSFMLASNQPLYPLTLALLVGPVGWAAWPLIFSTPFFGVVPYLSRRNPVAARILLPLVGILNTAAAHVVLGANSGVLIFLLPCLTLTGLLLQRSERLVLLALYALAMAVLLFLPAGPDVFNAEDGAFVTRLNFGSALTLTAFIGWVLMGRRA